ncbi:MAG: hypothetical protein HY225_00620 [Candidatus Vogelbacteria bacterium]|nr:hypothetical protein [Candidatus Vogelbacteria bacterium]
MSNFVKMSDKKLRKFIVDACREYRFEHLNMRYYPYEELGDAMKKNDALKMRVNDMAISIRDDKELDGEFEPLSNLLRLVEASGIVR